jgi:hypothetical protein
MQLQQVCVSVLVIGDGRVLFFLGALSPSSANLE